MMLGGGTHEAQDGCAHPATIPTSPEAWLGAVAGGIFAPQAAAACGETGGADQREAEVCESMKDHHNRMRCELLDDALPTLPLYKRAMIPSWAVWDIVYFHHYKRPYWFLQLWDYVK